MNTQSTNAKPYNDRLLVVGGGGARGAWGAGLSKYLADQFGPYRKAFGTSTGSLMIPLIVLNQYDKLKTAFTSVTQKSIFNVNPFNEQTGDLRTLNAIWRLVRGKPTLGESENLRSTIQQFIGPDEYQLLRTSPEKLEFTVTVTDFKTGQPEYRSSRDITDYATMVNWMWASGNEPLFMSYYNVGDHSYVDGGVLENIPLAFGLQYAQEHHYSEVDVIINKPKDGLTTNTFVPTGILAGLNRLIELFTLEIRKDDLLIPEITEALASCQDGLPPEEPRIHINLHYFPANLFTGLNVNELLFDAGRMKALWDAGEAGQRDARIMLAQPEAIAIPSSVLGKVLRRFIPQAPIPGQ